jgi:hypothetical protein
MENVGSIQCSEQPSLAPILSQLNPVYKFSRCLFKILLTYLFTEMSTSSGAANCAATQEPPSILWNPKFQYRIHKSSPLIPILSHINPIHTIPSYKPKIILILSTHLRLDLRSDLFPSGFPTNILYAFIFYLIRATCPSQLILHYLIILIILGEEYKL